MRAPVEVLSWGVAGALTDGGRPGRAAMGASRGGAVDLAALADANRVVGNPVGAAAFESSGGLRVRALTDCVVALAGALVEAGVANGPPLGWGAAAHLPAGAEVRLGRLIDGARVYLAVRGGADGQATGLIDPLVHPLLRPERPTLARLWPGPRRDWFGPGAWAALLAQPYTVRSTSRVGVRLEGAPLRRVRMGELASEGLIEGAVQVPPDGNPVVMLADHPTTGGYPVIAVVDPLDIAVLAQAPAGSTVRFVTAR